MNWHRYGKICILALLLLLAPRPFTLAAPPYAPTQPLAVIPACNPIATDTTWTTGNIYVVENCNLVIAAGATLTIQPGVIVKFWGTAPGHGSTLGSVPLIVEGALHAVGTAAAPIIFTSYADDAHGGDTNGNGDSSGAAGDWYGLVFQAGSVSQLEHFFVGYAGSGVFNARAGMGYGRAQMDVRGAAVTLRHGAITAGLRKGIYLEGAGVTPVIEALHIANNDDPANNYNTLGYAIYQSNINMQPTYGNLIFSGNDRDEVTIGSFNEPLTQDVTLGGANFGAVCGYSLCQLTVPAGITLTVQPGTLLDLGAAYGIAVASGGSLIAEGTSTQPVTFTSKLAAGGATNQYWMGLWAKQGSTLRLAHCDISYADNTNYGLGGLEINTDNASVNNCRIHHHKRDGLYIYARAGAVIHPILNNVDVTDNGQAGVYIDTSSGSSASVTWDGGHISHNGWSGVTGYTSNSSLNPTLRNLTIAGNGAAGNAAERRAGIYWNQHNVNAMLENLTITGNIGAAIFWYCNGSITARNLSASGNGLNELTLPGCDIGSGRQWNLGDAGIPVRITDHIVVSPNALLSLVPGTVLRFDKNRYNWPTYLTVQDQAALYALGTAERPIIFTGAVITDTGWWAGIEVIGRAAITLRHCEIGYGGFPNSNNLAASLVIRGGAESVPAANIQNCEIHHSGRKGVHFDLYNRPVAVPPVFRYNSLHDNTQAAVTNWNAPPLDARDNYWGDPTGPRHPTQNPGGLGDDVGNNILFYPWLGAPSSGAAPGEMLVSTGAPTLVSPGQTVDYAIQYFNGMTTTVENAVLLLQLPQAAEYMDSAGGGLYWAERHQVFWKLGDLPPNAHAFVSTRVRFQWGLPADYRDGSITFLAADNYNAGAFNTEEYAAYQPENITGQTTVSQAEFDALRATAPALQTLYEQAIAQGYRYLEAGRVAFDDGTSVTGAVFRTPDRRAVRLLTLYEGAALAVTNADGLYTLHDTTGGMTTTLNGLSRAYWGNWIAEAGAQTLGTTSPAACTSLACKTNCIGKKITFKYVTYSLGQMFMWTVATGGGGGVASAAYHTLHVAKMIYDCNNACNADPNSNCCTAGQVRWTVSGWFKLFGSACVKEVCGSAGRYGAPGTIYCTAGGQRCVAGYDNAGGCKDCVEGMATYSQVSLAPQSACAVNGSPKCSDLELLRAKDPNAIYGPAGDLLPGDRVTYTITYENEGAGRAYGVYVINVLPAVFDTRSISFTHGSGVYLPESRELLWLVGELGPKGAADSEGVITYTVALTGGLASGTVVANQAVVYFPSVPEETPTNTWVNQVMPLTAAPQNLTTPYMTPLTLTLWGRDVSGLPLTYAIIEPPHGGTLTGDLPTLTYTPAENFTGADSFSFQVSNGVTTSRPAQVYITVTPAGDTTPPQVVWTNPAADATNVAASATPILTNTLGPVYSPVILIGVSEALNATTVTSATVTLAREGGAPVLISAYFDNGSNQIVITPRVALAVGNYSATVTTGVSDLAGNPLAADYQWNFDTGRAPYHYIYLPLVLRTQ